MTTPNQNLLPVRRATDDYTLTEVEKVGTWIARSGMFGCTKPEQGQVIAIACREKGMNLFEFLDRYHVMFDGRIKLKSHAVFAEFRKAGGKIKWIKTGDDGKAAEADVTFEAQTVRVSFTIEQATAQLLVKKDSAWTKTPGNMLRARLITNAIGMLCPEIYLSGGDDDYNPPAPPLQMDAPKAAVEIRPVGGVPVEISVGSFEVKSPAADGVIDMQMMPVTVTQKVTQTEPPEDDSNAELMPTTAAAPVLPDDLLKQLAALLGNIEVEAVAFCRSINWLKDGETMENLSVGNARYIITKSGSFITKAIEFSRKATA